MMAAGPGSEAGPDRSRALIWLSAVLVVMAVAQFALGSTVRITGSGDACPDWPTCFGSLIPPLDALPADVELWQVLLEWVHRLNGALLGVVAIASSATALFLWRQRGWGRRGGPALSAYLQIATLVLVSITGVVGGTVVLSELDPALRTGHLVLALMVSFTASLSLAHEWRPAPESGVRTRGALIWGGVAFGAVLLVLVLGSYSVWRGAGLACTSWPGCSSPFDLPSGELQWINAVHRLASIVALLAGGYGLHVVLRRHRSVRARVYVSVGLAGLLGTALLGAAVATTVNAASLSGDDLILNLNRILHISSSSATWTGVCLAFAAVLFAPLRHVNK